MGVRYISGTAITVRTSSRLMLTSLASLGTEACKASAQRPVVVLVALLELPDHGIDARAACLVPWAREVLVAYEALGA